MTTITIERELLEQALAALSAPNYRVFSESSVASKLRAALSAPATEPDFPVNWAQMIHYPECWDTAAYKVEFDLDYYVNEVNKLTKGLT